MNVIPPRGQIPDIPPWSWISLIDTRWSHALSLNTLKTIHFIFLFDPHIYPHTPHSHSHTSQVAHLIINSSSLHLQPAPNQSFAFGKEIGPPRRPFSVSGQPTPLFAPGGMNQWGGACLFLGAGPF